jgi:hypothetical protein
LGQDFEQRAFARAIAANDAQHLALPDVKAHAVQGPELLAYVARMTFLPDLEAGIGLALHLGAPAGKILLERAAANLAQPVGLAHVFYGNGSAHFKIWKSTKQKVETWKIEMHFDFLFLPFP